jgi:hydrogenase maturation factor HypE
MKNKIIKGLLVVLLLVSVCFNIAQYNHSQKAQELINAKQQIIVKAEFRLHLMNVRNTELLQLNKEMRDLKEQYRKAYITEVKKYH